jgi:hypothetical protein
MEENTHKPAPSVPPVLAVRCETGRSQVTSAPSGAVGPPTVSVSASSIQCGVFGAGSGFDGAGCTGRGFGQSLQAQGQIFKAHNPAAMKITADLSKSGKVMIAFLSAQGE